PGAKVPPLTSVNLVLSKGTQPTQNLNVRSVVGLPQGQATNQVTKPGLKAQATSSHCSNTLPSPAGISQTHSRRAKVPPLTSVNLVLSKGPQPTPVPDVRRLTRGDAEQALKAAGFSYSETQATGAQDIVLSQSPAGGTLEPPGYTVAITIG